MKTQKVNVLPRIETVKDGEYFEIINAGMWWGCFKACKNWVGERFFLPCDNEGNVY